ncbi:MAG TPA: hypothetical protein ACFYD4_16440, partial [Candidatus Wunengus sp. YC61]
AAMRFGAALDLWHKGDLHIDEGDEVKEAKKAVSEAKNDVPDFDPSPPVQEGEKAPATIKPGSTLHKHLEVSLSEEGIDREWFKEWLKSIEWLSEKDGKLSLSTLTEQRAKTIVDRWRSCVDSYTAWLLCGRVVHEA